jgi:hypothetical protein
MHVTGRLSGSRKAVTTQLLIPHRVQLVGSFRSDWQCFSQGRYIPLLMHIALRSFPAELLEVPFPNPMVPCCLISTRCTGAAQSTFQSLHDVCLHCRSVQQEQIQ